MHLTNEQIAAIREFNEAREGLALKFAREGFMWLEPFSTKQPRRIAVFVRYNGQIIQSFDDGETWRFDNREHTEVTGKFALKLLRQHYRNKKWGFINSQPGRMREIRRKRTIEAAWGDNGTRVLSFV